MTLAKARQEQRKTLAVISFLRLQIMKYHLALIKTDYTAATKLRSPLCTINSFVSVYQLNPLLPAQSGQINSIASDHLQMLHRKAFQDESAVCNVCLVMKSSRNE